MVQLANVEKPSDKIINCAEIMLVIFGHGYYDNNPPATWKKFTSEIINNRHLKATRGLIEAPKEDIHLVGYLLKGKEMTRENL